MTILVVLRGTEYELSHGVCQYWLSLASLFEISRYFFSFLDFTRLVPEWISSCRTISSVMIRASPFYPKQRSQGFIAELHFPSRAMDALPSFYLDDIWFESAALIPAVQAEKPLPKEHFDLISFLSVAQSTQTDFLPITWHSALQLLGEGGEAEVSQSLVDLQTNFAFKRTKDRTDRDKSFEALIAALLVLQNPTFRRHPNISKLIGVCWEVEHESGDIWPVLVSERAPLGDLRQFLDSEQGCSMPVEDRIRLCIDVLSGIEALHSFSTLH